MQGTATGTERSLVKYRVQKLEQSLWAQRRRDCVFIETRCINFCKVLNVVVIDCNNVLNDLVQALKIMAVDERIWIKFARYQWISPVDGHCIGDESVHDLLRRVTWRRGVLKSYGKLKTTLKVNL